MMNTSELGGRRGCKLVPALVQLIALNASIAGAVMMMNRAHMAVIENWMDAKMSEVEPDARRVDIDAELARFQQWHSLKMVAIIVMVDVMLCVVGFSVVMWVGLH
jgi:hypothetical protein